MNIISICNQKGGVGKTTTTINLGAALAKTGRRVLVVDLDGQRNLTRTVQTEQHGNRSIVDLIYAEASGVEYDPSQFAFYSEREGFHYIAACNMLASAPSILANSSDSNIVLRKVLRHSFFAQYDDILIDCRPLLDLLAVNAMAASTQIIIPVEPEEYAVAGITDLWSSIQRTKQTLNPELRVNGILITKADVRRTLTHSMEEQLRVTFGDMVYQTVMPFLADAANATSCGTSAVNLPKNSRLGRLYEEFAKEVIERCQQNTEAKA